MNNNLHNNQAKEQIKRICEDLQREYDLTADRRKTLTGQATNLMGFGAIIETILIGLIILFATNSDAKALLTDSGQWPYLAFFAAIGFVAYITATIFALISYWESKWKPAPTIPELGNKSSNEINCLFLLASSMKIGDYEIPKTYEQ